MMWPPAVCELSVAWLPVPTITGEWLPVRMSPLVTVLPSPCTAPLPLAMSPWLLPAMLTPPSPCWTWLPPRVMSPKPRLNAPCWALAPACWSGLSTGMLLPLATGTLLLLAKSVLGAKVGCETKPVCGENGEDML
ncbi:Uncharacterised protein [Mycobacteroides abscessus subsp. abscessus]|nr:Uncharacterised protein [Mycobacteroides abscessus subsp. abscessus]